MAGKEVMLHVDCSAAPILIAAAIACSFSAPATAHYYNASFDCGRGQTVWIANPVEGDGAKRSRKIIFEITISDFDFTKGPIRSPVVRWNPDKDEVTVDGRHCRLLTDEEAAELDARGRQ
jgi:hypothetical protein